jgi:transcription antitermination factor NusG
MSCSVPLGSPIDAPMCGPGPSRAASQWFAVYTQSRHEHRVAQHFATQAIQHFLPLYRAQRQWKDRRATLELPLFPNYLFVQIALEARVAVLRTPGVVGFVSSGAKPSPLDDYEIETLRSGLHLRKVTPHSYLVVGERVRIRSGPMRGLEGVLVRQNNSDRVVITLSQIKQSIAVEISADELEPARRSTSL